MTMREIRAFSIFSLGLLLCFAGPGLVNSAAAQQQEKRIALVVGDGAYAKAPLATAANDAGLIAQTLQAAGFDVVGARDLDGDTLRKSFRDFIQKAESSGPDTVAMVYLAGYGMQLAGENYFIPVDSSLGRDVDIPIEGLRISDYQRQLASLPLKASIVVLDAARQQPFIEGGQPIASGLALVEPDPHMLLAFNAAPGTIAPNEQGNYGVYAQSLAEMIRTGGLQLPEVFDRVRLRVNDASKGAQVPWDAQKIDAPFMFFDRAPDAPASAPPDQAAAMRNRPIRDLGVQDAYAAALERDTMAGYEDFLNTYSADPLARRVRAIVAARREAITWLRTYRTDTPPAYWSYLRRYPRGPHAYDARRRLAILTAPLEPPPAFAVIDYDVAPPPPDEIVYVDRPVLYFSDPEFDFVPPPPPPVYFCPPPPPDFVVLPPPFAAVGLFILPQPVFVPIPVFVRAPVYVSPPPNNIIYANIHNTTVINNVINQRPAQVAPAAPGAPAGAAAVAPNTQPNVKGGPGQGAITPVSTGAQVQTPVSVTKKAAAIQKGEEPPPKSAIINGSVKSATSGAQPGQTGTPATKLQTDVNTLPKEKALPGSKQGTPLPQGAKEPALGAANLNQKLVPENKSVTNNPATGPGNPASGGNARTNPTVPLVEKPKAGGPVQTPETKTAVPETRTVLPDTKTAIPEKKTIAPETGNTRKEVTPPPPSQPAVAPPKPAPPVAHVEPTRRAAPPPPPPPPPRPAPQAARPAPPPPPRVAPPPPPPPRPPPVAAVRPPPPPPPPRPPPPPPKPAPAPAAAKKCPPNVAKC
jgi:uncharacterized caspase-like protein